MELEDLSAWARADGLEIVLLVLGAILLGRFLCWAAWFVELRLQEGDGDLATSLRTDQARHVYAVVQAGQHLATVLLWFVAASSTGRPRSWRSS